MGFADEEHPKSLSSHPVCKIANLKVCLLSSGEEEVATKYQKMLKMGMPAGAVIQKMNVDGIPQNIQHSIIEGEDPPPTVSPEEASQKVSTLTSEEQEVATKYR